MRARGVQSPVIGLPVARDHVGLASHLDLVHVPTVIGVRHSGAPRIGQPFPTWTPTPSAIIHWLDSRRAEFRPGRLAGRARGSCRGSAPYSGARPRPSGAPQPPGAARRWLPPVLRRLVSPAVALDPCLQALVGLAEGGQGLLPACVAVRSLIALSASASSTTALPRCRTARGRRLALDHGRREGRGFRHGPGDLPRRRRRARSRRRRRDPPSRRKASTGRCQAAWSSVTGTVTFTVQGASRRCCERETADPSVGERGLDRAACPALPGPGRGSGAPAGPGGQAGRAPGRRPAAARR